MSWTLSSVVDSALVSLNETLKSIVSEAFANGDQIVGGLATTMVVLRHPTYLMSRRKRIVGPSVPEEAIPRVRSVSEFSKLVDEDEFAGANDAAACDSDGIEGEILGHNATPPDPRRASLSGLVHADADPVCTAQRFSTGLVEDVELATLLLVDRAVERARQLARLRLDGLTLRHVLAGSLVAMRSVPSAPPALHALAVASTRSAQQVRGLLRGEIDKRTTAQLIQAAGYPYESHWVTTADGYTLLLERLPRHGAAKVAYFQHGVLDTAFGWIGTGPLGSAAYQAYERGCDVWAGNFRGSGDRQHVDPDMGNAEYWDFSVNEHAHGDMDAFIRRIHETKCTEARTQDAATLPYHLTVISHSMGGAATLMHLVYKRRLEEAHHIAQVVLLSPAGYHRDVPLFCRMTGPLLDATLAKTLHSVRFPGESVRSLASKVMEDVKRLPAVSDLVSIAGGGLLGGDMATFPHKTVANITYNMSGTSTKIFRHFMQLMRTGRFQTFDHGDAAENLLQYGQAEPVNMLAEYHRIDIPVHFVFGTQDHLIPPYNVLRQYNALRSFHPDRAFLRMFDGGHADCTVGLNYELLTYLLNTLGLGDADSEGSEGGEGGERGEGSV